MGSALHDSAKTAAKTTAMTTATTAPADPTQRNFSLRNIMSCRANALNNALQYSLTVPEMHAQRQR